MARKRTLPRRSGFLVIDKPPGWTSHDVVARVRRIVGERQVGHAGTLDPAATGVLPVAVGHATKVLPWIEDADKAYIATVRFGVTTDSADRDGRLLATSDIRDLDAGVIARALDPFRGEIAQIPPAHSAIKVDGRRLYDLARAGAEVDVPVRRVVIHAIDLLNWDPPHATIHVACSKGTYIRSIARDLGEAVGTGAMLAALVRTCAGRFHLRESIPLDALEDRLERHGWEWLVLHPDAALPDVPAVVLDREAEARWQHGLPVETRAAGAVARVYDSRRAWVGIGDIDAAAAVIRPRRVIQGTAE